MAILAVYDTVGIQEYIFSSNKLKENVGASNLVSDMLEVILPEIIKSRGGVFDWRKQKGLNETARAEIIYQGGGNAYVVFENEEIFQSVSEEFLIAVTEKTRGIGIAVAAIETELANTYKSDFQNLNRRLSLIKGNFNIPVSAGSQPITKQSARTGRPVSAYVNDGVEKEYIDLTQKRKRGGRSDSSSTPSFDDLIKNTKGQNSFVAVIHADGNNMSQHIDKFMNNFCTYKEAVPKMRELSQKISKCYSEALQRTQDKFTQIETIKIISDGDDITLVVPGRYALNYAASLLREIENTPIENRPFPNRIPTACAGVTLFHSHYPFANAYSLAEECCASAKRLSRDVDGSYIDFHIHSSGFVTDLNSLRKKQYSVKNQSILCRPWCVSTGTTYDNYPSFDWLIENAGLKHWARNKSQLLRNKISGSDADAELLIRQAKSRGYDMPSFKFSVGDEHSKYAPYFDALEIAELCEDII